MTNFRGVILDVDGTLVDSNDAHAKAWVEALHKNGYNVSYDEVRRAIGMGSDNLLPNTIGVKKETPEGKKISDDWSKIFEEKYLPYLKAFPKSRELLQRMRQSGLKLVVGSSAKKAQLDPLLELAGATDLIEQETSADDAKNSKPDPDIIQASLKRLGLPAEQTVMLGDTPYDIEAAGKAGVKTIALRCGGWPDDALKGAIAIYNDPADLLQHFDQAPF